MSERSPTIEQNTSFSAKTEQGDDVEFNTTLKLYIDPTEDVTVTIGGNLPQEEPKPFREEPKETPQGTEPSSQKKPVPSENLPKFKNKDESSIRNEKPSSQSEKPCSMPNFNPCQGINDGVKAVKKLYQSYFYDEKHSKSKKKIGEFGESAKLEKREGGLSESENEVLKNEEKYEM